MGWGGGSKEGKIIKRGELRKTVKETVKEKKKSKIVPFIVSGRRGSGSRANFWRTSYC